MAPRVNALAAKLGAETYKGFDNIVEKLQGSDLDEARPGDNYNWIAKAMDEGRRIIVTGPFSGYASYPDITSYAYLIETWAISDRGYETLDYTWYDANN